MEKSIQYLLTLFLATLITYTGSGVNAYSFCCDDCRYEGTVAVTKNLCCEIHLHNHKKSLNSCQYPTDKYLCEFDSGDICKVEHISCNWESSLPQMDLQPNTVSLFDSTLTPHNSSIIPNTFPLLLLHTGSQKPPNLSSKTYAALLTTLQIWFTPYPPINWCKGDMIATHQCAAICIHSVQPLTQH